MPRTIPFLIWLPLALSCATENAQFTTQFAPSAVREQRRLSVLGVYKDGRLDPIYWDTIGAQVAEALGRPSCEALFNARLNAEAPDLYDQTDRETKDGGISAEIVARLADRAESDAILVFEVSGRTPQKRPSNAPLANTGSAASQHGRGNIGSQRHSSTQEYARDDDAMIFSWKLFAAQSHESIGESTLRYTGQSEDEAMKLFLGRLQSELPGATCAGWKWNVAPEPASVAPEPASVK